MSFIPAAGALIVLSVYRLLVRVKLVRQATWQIAELVRETGDTTTLVLARREGPGPFARRRAGQFAIIRVRDGGSSSISRLMNYHFWSAAHRKNDTYKSMLYATDIVKIVPPYPSFLPPENTDYPIFGEPVYSPIDGIVVKVENSITDNRPYSGNYPYNTGNTVVIRKGDLYSLLGHLKEGSVMVKVGDDVKSGQPIARAGNSGMSERPHVHIQLVKSETDNFWLGTGVGIRYGGRNLYKNRVIST